MFCNAAETARASRFRSSLDHVPKRPNTWTLFQNSTELFKIEKKGATLSCALAGSRSRLTESIDGIQWNCESARDEPRSERRSRELKRTRRDLVAFHNTSFFVTGNEIRVTRIDTLLDAGSRISRSESKARVRAASI